MPAASTGAALPGALLLVLGRLERPNGKDLGHRPALRGQRKLGDSRDGADPSQKRLVRARSGEISHLDPDPTSVRARPEAPGLELRLRPAQPRDQLGRAFRGLEEELAAVQEPLPAATMPQ